MDEKVSLGEFFVTRSKHVQLTKSSIKPVNFTTWLRFNGSFNQKRCTLSTTFSEKPHSQYSLLYTIKSRNKQPHQIYLSPNIKPKLRPSDRPGQLSCTNNSWWSISCIPCKIPKKKYLILHCKTRMQIWPYQT